eukprot:scaffold11536_cov107-Isochrysis_galbana.AAC.3
MVCTASGDVTEDTLMTSVDAVCSVTTMSPTRDESKMASTSRKPGKPLATHDTLSSPLGRAFPVT